MQITFLELKSRQLTFCLSTAPEGEVWSVCGGGGGIGTPSHPPHPPHPPRLVVFFSNMYK